MGHSKKVVLHEIVKVIQTNNIWISTVWIPTAKNLADGPSRGIFPTHSLLYAFPPKVPYDLKPYLHKSVDYHDPHVT
jgi:hypothetical protein